MSFPADAFTGHVHPEIRAYLAALQPVEDPLVAAMEEAAAPRKFPIVGRESGRWLEQLTRMIGGKRVFEFGSGFGYSAFFFARAVGEGGLVVATDKDQSEQDLHEKLFAGHPLKPRIKHVVGSAFDSFAAEPGGFDVIFIDMHKPGYPIAFDLAVPRVRKGGLILADNVLWGGKVARDNPDENTAALQLYTKKAFSDPRVSTMILPTGDGLAVSVVL